MNATTIRIVSLVPDGTCLAALLSQLTPVPLLCEPLSLGEVLLNRPAIDTRQSGEERERR
jgi:hypothetical protein